MFVYKKKVKYPKYGKSRIQVTWWIKLIQLIKLIKLIQ